jgi:hypothetical protein
MLLPTPNTWKKTKSVKKSENIFKTPPFARFRWSSDNGAEPCERADQPNESVRFSNENGGLSNENVKLSYGCGTLSNERVKLSNGNVRLSNGNVRFSNGSARLSNGNIRLSNEILSKKRQLAGRKCG